jgi:hypothetical protein
MQQRQVAGALFSVIAPAFFGDICIFLTELIGFFSKLQYALPHSTRIINNL